MKPQKSAQEMQQQQQHYGMPDRYTKTHKRPLGGGPYLPQQRSFESSSEEELRSTPEFEGELALSSRFSLFVSFYINNFLCRFEQEKAQSFYFPSPLGSHRTELKITGSNVARAFADSKSDIERSIVKLNPSSSICDFFLIYSFSFSLFPKEHKQHSKQTLQVDLITALLFFALSAQSAVLLETISENENKQKCDRDLQSVLREGERTKNELQEKSFAPTSQREGINYCTF